VDCVVKGVNSYETEVFKIRLMERKDWGAVLLELQIAEVFHRMGRGMEIGVNVFEVMSKYFCMRIKGRLVMRCQA